MTRNIIFGIWTEKVRAHYLFRTILRNGMNYRMWLEARTKFIPQKLRRDMGSVYLRF